MCFVNIYAAQHHTDPNLEQSGGEKKNRILSKFDFGSWF